MKFATAIRSILTLTVLAAAARADEPTVDLEASTPAIVKIKARMSARESKLDAYKKTGAAGEGLSGLVEARPLANMDLAEKKSLHDVLAAENEDRTALFREIALANRLEDAAPVAAAYARAKRLTAAPENWLQSPQTKDWVQKKNLGE